MANYDHLFKVIIVGDGGVGKTSLTRRFSEGVFNSDYKLTIGVGFAVKTIKVENKTIKIQIWDTGGQERFSKIRLLYFKGALGSLIVFDVSNRESFNHVEKWIAEIRENCGTIPVILVGNKIDVGSREVFTEEGEALAHKLGVSYIETSAKTGENIKECFTELTRKILKQLSISDTC
ncbi:MAG: Rab family GTPase [Candidatus Odinarchaeia archaeon]